MSITKCPECGGTLITDYRHAELYCEDCGIIITERLVDLGPEWRAYDSEQASKRVRTGPGSSYRIHDKGLSTAAPKLPAKRLRWASMDSSEKTLAFALTEIDRMASALKLPDDIKEETSMLYRKAAAKKLIKGRSIEELVSAMLYIVCRQNGVPRTLREIAAVSRVPIKQIRKTYLHHIKRKMNIKLAPADAAQYIPRFCSELKLNVAIGQESIKLLNQNKIVVAKMSSPVVIAGGALFKIAEKHGVSSERVAEVAGVSKSSVETAAKKLKELK